jgi:uncharacterized protein YjbI with pentapeptide repeats
MANPEHLKILKQGVEAWNAWHKQVWDIWREQHPVDALIPDLTDFNRADLSGANLSGTNLCGVNLRGTNLKGANLSGANLSNADLWNAELEGANLSMAKLGDEDLCSGADLRWARLNRANLSGAFVIKANLERANLTGANLSRALLSGSDFSRADFTDANLCGAGLFQANLCGAILKKTKLNEARINDTLYGNVDFREIIGLNEVIQNGPSTIGIDSIYESHGEITDKFLHDAGVPEEIIDIARLLRAGPAIQWHSCFISYSTKDDEFARRLHARMTESNMRVWFAPKDLKGGKKLHEQLFEAIQIHDRLLIVLSEHSIQSEWVMTEIRKAREVEKKEKRRKLFPIRLTDFETLRDWTCFDADTGKDLAVEVREYFIPDFSNWKVLADGHPAAFESAFARLKKDLEAENSKKP